MIRTEKKYSLLKDEKANITITGINKSREDCKKLSCY